jgi:hypothetical protein
MLGGGGANVSPAVATTSFVSVEEDCITSAIDKPQFQRCKHSCEIVGKVWRELVLYLTAMVGLNTVVTDYQSLRLDIFRLVGALV